MIAHEHYAVDIERIVEIVTPRAVTRIPNADLSVVGILSLRGTIVTLVDVRRKLRHPAAGEPDADTRIVVIDNKNEMIGFVEKRRPERVMMVTECSMADNVAMEVPGVEFVRPCNLCPHMKRITLAKIRHSLETMTTAVEVDPDVAERARRSVDRMLAIGGSR